MKKFTLTREEAVLMVIDVQERLAAAMKDRERVVGRNCVLISAASQLGIPVIATEQYPRGLGATVPEINDQLKEGCKFEKMTFSGCTDQVLSCLEGMGRRKVILTGMETHVCVFQTARDLLNHGYAVFVAADAVCSRTEENYSSGLDLMREMGAVVSNTETILFDLLKEAGTSEFKFVSGLVK
ncbi:MAG: isochorismatase family protein [Peptococcaceae bacterium]|nr:isochorismatase family protein [Peptococcaceae bacterium]MDH7525667.1 isochorismatase family protein [Peptococcaceae bacterium]